MEGLQALNRSLANPVKGSSGAEARKNLEQFIAQHQSCLVQGSLWGPAEECRDVRRPPDDLGPLVTALCDHTICSNTHLLNVMIALRILLRRQSNRAALPKGAVRAVAELLKEPRSPIVIKETFKLVLCMCYEQRNVMAFVELGGVQHLLRYLGKLSDAELQASLLGALQSICYQAIGRACVREGSNVVESVAGFLRSAHPKVRARAVGTLHNLTADPKAIVSVRATGSLPYLVDMLRSSDPEVCATAAGSLQNCSREASSRDLIEQLGAIEPLSDLLSSSDVYCQSCAAGALFNIMIPKLESPQAVADFKTLLTDSIVLGVLRSCLEEGAQEGDL